MKTMQNAWSSQAESDTSDSDMIADFDNANTRRYVMQETQMSRTPATDGDRTAARGRESQCGQLVLWTVNFLEETAKGSKIFMNKVALKVSFRGKEFAHFFNSS